tara:strand:- start:317 stop:493 length:177 start_codon:yes stop_codon:yes gene_type:complete
MIRRKVNDVKFDVYETLDDAVEAALVMCDALETVVKITECEGGYELFGTGKFVKEVTG